MDETPGGFDLLITALVVYILAGLVLIGAMPPGAELGWTGVLLVASVVLAGLVIEALWKVRPWVTRASVALAVTMLAEVAVISIGMGVPGALGRILGTAAVLIAIVSYVHIRAGRILGARMARRP